MQIRLEAGKLSSVDVELQGVVPEVVNLAVEKAPGADDLRGVQLVPPAELCEGELGGIAVDPAV